MAETAKADGGGVRAGGHGVHEHLRCVKLTFGDIKISLCPVHNEIASSASAALRDADIRSALSPWLQERHAQEVGTKIVHELKMPRPSARIDMAVLNGELSGFEIKSDVDSLQRLGRQITAFSAVFDRVSVVTTTRYLRAIETTIPSWWGLILVARSREGLSEFHTIQGSIQNPTFDSRAFIWLLSFKEIRISFPKHQTSTKIRRNQLIDDIVENYSDLDVHDAVLGTLKQRF